MPTYYVDDGGSATAPYDTWAKAATSLSALDDAVSLTYGDIIYIGHDHVCPYTHSAHRTITGPNGTTSSNPPVKIISATTGSTPPTYQASDTNQVDTSEGAYDLIFDGAFVLYGCRLKSGRNIGIKTYYYQASGFHDCKLLLGHGGTLNAPSGSFSGNNTIRNITIDLSADSSNTTATVIQLPEGWDAIGINVNNGGYRTGVLITESLGSRFSAIDASSCTALFYLAGAGAPGYMEVTNVACQSSVVGFRANQFPYGGKSTISAGNFGAADAPESLCYQTNSGRVQSYSTIYRSGGASIEGVSTSWLMRTDVVTYSSGDDTPMRSPWIHGYISSTGSKTFDIYITNDTADFTDAEVWMELEYLGVENSALTVFTTDRVASPTATAVAQTDDTSSTWTGTGPAFTYKQKLSVTATVGEEGQFRARVCCAVIGLGASRNFFIDPKVTVT